MSHFDENACVFINKIQKLLFIFHFKLFQYYNLLSHVFKSFTPQTAVNGGRYVYMPTHQFVLGSWDLKNHG